MQVETILTYSISFIGVLLVWLMGMVVYFFHSLKGEVVALRHELVIISENNSRLVHKQECHNSVSRVHERLDEFDAQNKSLGERLTRIETSHDACNRCSV